MMSLERLVVPESKELFNPLPRNKQTHNGGVYIKGTQKPTPKSPQWAKAGEI